MYLIFTRDSTKRSLQLLSYFCRSVRLSVPQLLSYTKQYHNQARVR